MKFNTRYVLHTVRTASFNAEAAAELLLEMSKLVPTARLAYRAMNLVELINEDADDLERIANAIGNGELLVVPSSAGYLSTPQ
ncbi:hypothetical protein [Pseudomonas sp. H9]|uniref:hypothetical protein n=1 Tax=Pseudomonas sp. H9 TaxID=483968 RepID=UPI001057AA89|nr:hypothetical protein [Pseudomonas sp. H9]TDF84009.1 hypothetical protein E1573_09705 [Pseudomonas sp. H9]